MECLYCHKKFSTFRFWKSSEFCSEEHAEAYRGQTLSRLMDGGGASSKSPPPFEDALGRANEEPQIPPSKHADAPQLEAPALRSSPLDSQPFTQPPSRTDAVEADLGTSALSSDVGGIPSDMPPVEGLSRKGAGEVDLQTPEEALNALRDLARGSQTPSLPPPLEEQPQAIRAESKPSATSDDVDADDVFAELRRMAEATGKTELEEKAEEAIDLPTVPNGLSAFDRLMETRTPSAGVGRPRLERREGVDEEAGKPAPTFASAKEYAAKEETQVDAEAVHDKTSPGAPRAEVTAQHQEKTEPVPEKTDDKVVVEEGGEKVVSFPGPQQTPGRESDGRRPGRMARLRGAASGLFDSGLHEELMTVDLNGLLRDVSGFPVKSTIVALDGMLKEPDAESCSTPMCELTLVGAAGVDWPQPTDLPSILVAADASSLPQEVPVTSDLAIWEPPAAKFAPGALAFVAPDRALRPASDWDDLVSAISLRDLGGHPEFAVEQRFEPSVATIQPHLPVGLAESMGVVTPNRGQLIRSELFIKEPEVRECAVEACDSTPVIDVRRAYYGRQGTA